MMAFAILGSASVATQNPANYCHSTWPPNERCSRQALFGCGFAAMVVACLQLN
jgi:hypothetical protein